MMRHILCFRFRAAHSCMRTGVRHGAEFRRVVSKSAANQNSTRYRWMVASRALAAIVGGFVLTSLATAVGSLLLPLVSSTPRAQAVLITTLLSFVLWTCVALWIFSTRSAARAWLGIAIPSVVLGVALILLR